MTAFVYIIQSQSNHYYYIGSAIEPYKRLHEHNRGLNKSTKNKGPWELRFTQEYSSLKQAKQIEFRLKKLKRRDIIEKIVRDKEIKITITGISAAGSAQRSGR